MKKKKFKMLVTDCDGVLTDSGMYYFDNNMEGKKFNTRDGKAFEILREKGILTCIITGENTKIVENRAKKMKIDFLVQGSTNKKNDLLDMCSKNNISLSEVVYIGDDLNDLETMKIVGLSVCPKDAVKEVRKTAKYKSAKLGGNGVVRDVVEKFFKE